MQLTFPLSPFHTQSSYEWKASITFNNNALRESLQNVSGNLVCSFKTTTLLNFVWRHKWILPCALSAASNRVSFWNDAAAAVLCHLERFKADKFLNLLLILHASQSLYPYIASTFISCNNVVRFRLFFPVKGVSASTLIIPKYKRSSTGGVGMRVM